ncbi:hypothetical protein TELCIR_19221 [Teladorsagia circumcincta]|uniref:Uncharacterized protein n=1 Tax=Teladorsagia circumcincta TaxID=45464 RepID=A0A2G9TN39_TELCI|nr:hypothetical protein TELCIR_19221 [Teladorsagia circumcincta]
MEIFGEVKRASDKIRRLPSEPFVSMTSPMYREYRVKELVDETMKTVVEAACSFESDRATVIEIRQGPEGGAAELTVSLQVTEAEETAPLVQSALLYIVERYKHVRPLWQFGLKIDESNKDWKTLLFNDFYFR